MKENQFAKSAICQIYLILPKNMVKKKSVQRDVCDVRKLGHRGKKMSFSGEKMDINIAHILKGREGGLVPEMGRGEMER